MPSPFPGMNPYLESTAVWHDFHERFIPALAEWLGPQLFPKYLVKIDENMYVHDVSRREIAGRPDIGIVHDSGPSGVRGAAAVLEPPVLVRLAKIDTEALSYIEISDSDSRALVTVIELLSPSNKRPGPQRDQYLLKRREWTSAPANLVEIDLLRAWPPMPDEHRPVSDYSILVSRQSAPTEAGLWPFNLRDSFPVVPLPLLPGDSDATLEFKPAFDRVYDGAGYEYYVYKNPPSPRLAGDDQSWADAVLAARLHSGAR